MEEQIKILNQRVDVLEKIVKDIIYLNFQKMLFEFSKDVISQIKLNNEEESISKEIYQDKLRKLAKERGVKYE
jgi:hypothetical protein